MQKAVAVHSECVSSKVLPSLQGLPWGKGDIERQPATSEDHRSYEAVANYFDRYRYNHYLINFVIISNNLLAINFNGVGDHMPDKTAKFTRSIRKKEECCYSVVSQPQFYNLWK